MSYIEATIEDIFTEQPGQILKSSLHLKAENGKPSLFGLFDWDTAGDPNGNLYQVEVTGNSGVGTFPKGGPYNAPGTMVKVPAKQLLYGRYHVPIELTKSDEAKMALAGDPRSVINNFLDVNFVRGLAKMHDQVETDLIGNSRISGGDANGVQGFVDVRSASNTYLDVNATTYSTTGAVHALNGGTPRAMTYALLQSTDTTFTDTNKGDYNVVLCSKAREKAIQDLDPSSNNVGSPSMQTLTTREGVERSYSAGFVNTFFNGRMVLGLPGYTSTVVDFVDTRALKGHILRMGPPEKSVSGDTIRWVFVLELRAWVEMRDQSFASLGDLS